MTAPTPATIPGISETQELPKGPEPKKIDKKYELNLWDSGVRVNEFRNLAFLHWRKMVFFLTNAYAAALLDFMEHNFLQYLSENEDWRLYISDIVFEYLEYLQKVKHSFWCNNLPPDILTSMIEKGRIVILRVTPTRIPELSNSTGNIITAYIGQRHPEYLFLEVYFDIFKVEMSSVERPQVKLALKNRVVIRNQREFLPDMRAADAATPRSSIAPTPLCYAGLENFQVELERLGRSMFANPGTHFQLSIGGQNEFVKLWYISQFYLHLELKTHVTPPLAEFARKFFLNADEYLFDDNRDEKCRLHYDCCEHTSNEMCVPNREWALDFEVHRIYVAYSKNYEELYRRHRPSANYTSFVFPSIHSD